MPPSSRWVSDGARRATAWCIGREHAPVEINSFPASALRRPCPVWGIRAAGDGDSNLDNSGACLWLSLCTTMSIQEAVGTS